MTCQCPRFAEKKARHEALINHTYACLVKQRGANTLREQYGPPAKVEKAA
jgi:hypothetical protein